MGYCIIEGVILLLGGEWLVGKIVLLIRFEVDSFKFFFRMVGERKFLFFRVVF